MQTTSLTILTLAMFTLINPLAKSFSCGSMDEGKPRCPSVSNPTSTYPAYNAACSSCNTMSGVSIMYCKCPSGSLEVTSWQNCMNMPSGYLSYYNNTIVCAYIGSGGTQVNSPVPPGFSVQPAVANFKNNASKYPQKKNVR